MLNGSKHAALRRDRFHTTPLKLFGLCCQYLVPVQVNVWVQISDPAGFVWDSKQYLAPVIAPAEAVAAWRELVASNTRCAPLLRA